jgi:two-component system, NarL family, nitrate/nitrite response regulator NarL
MTGGSQSTGTVVVARGALLREGVAALLRNSPYKIIATAQRPSELKNLQHPASGSRILIIVGLDDSNLELGENVRSLRSLFPGSTIVVIAESHSAANLQQIVMAGPNGYVANLSSRDVLLKLLEVASLDQQVIVLSRPNTSMTAADESESMTRSNSINDAGDLQHFAVRKFSEKDPQLSQRERQILVRLAEGDSNKQIARLCNITESTVKVHLKAILRKITVHNRTQAAIWAIAKGYHRNPELVDQKSTLTSPRIADRSSVQDQTANANGKFLQTTASK